MAESISPRRRPRARLFAFIAIPLVLLGAGLTYAHQHGGHHGGMLSEQGIEMHLDHVQVMLGKVGASDAQKAQIDGILKAGFSDFKGAHDNCHASLGKLHELLLAPSVDRAKIEALRAEQAQALDDASRRLVSSLEDAVEVLTPEQREAFARAVQDHHAG